MLGVSDPFTAFCVDRAIWKFAKTILDDQERAVARLPKTAKDTAHTKARQRVLDEYLGVELSTQPHRFRAPG